MSDSAERETTAEERARWRADGWGIAERSRRLIADIARRDEALALAERALELGRGRMLRLETSRRKALTAIRKIKEPEKGEMG